MANLETVLCINSPPVGVNAATGARRLFRRAVRSLDSASAGRAEQIGVTLDQTAMAAEMPDLPGQGILGQTAIAEIDLGFGMTQTLVELGSAAFPLAGVADVVQHCTGACEA